MLITRHRVPGHVFALLSRGHADAEVMGLLRASQLSKQTLLIRAVRDAARPLRRTVAAARPDDAVALIDLAQRLAPAAAAEVLGHPLVGAWAALCLRRLRHPAQTGAPLWVDLGHLGAVAAAAGIRAGAEVALPVPLRRGTVALPTLGRATLASDAQWGVATVRGHAGGYVVEGQRQAVPLPPEPARPGPGWEPVHRFTMTEAGGETLTVLLDDVDPYRGSHGLPAAPRLDPDGLARWHTQLAQAWALLVREHPERAAELGAAAITVVPLADPGGASPYRNATARDSPGAMHLTSPPDPFHLALSLVHELQHTKLGALLDLVELYDPTERRRFYSPWRTDPRPVGGLLQGAYAFLAVAGCWARYATPDGTVGSRRAEYEFARLRGQVRTALAELTGSGSLTGPGRVFVDGLRDAVAALATGPVTAEPARLAKLARDDHWVSWRLRNLVVDPAAVTGLCAAWRSGAPRPIDLPPARVMAGDAREGSRHQRALASLTASAPGDDPDAALLAGDYPTAARGFLDRIRAEHSGPGQLEPWVGLALARMRSGPDRGSRTYATEPEVLYALHAHLAAQACAAEPDPLAAWLAS